MKKDDLFLVIICLLLCVCICEKALAKKKFSPLSNLQLEHTLLSPGNIITISGTGFIPSYESIYRIKLFNNLDIFDLELKEAKLNEISIFIPKSIPYGDYSLSIKLKSNYLRSKKYIFDEKIKIRPEPLLLNFKADEVFLSKQDLHDFIISELEETLNDRKLLESDLVFYLNKQAFDFKLMNLAEGENILALSYKSDIYESLHSEPVSVMFLSEELYYPEIDVLSLNPIEANLLRLDTKTSISVDDYVAEVSENSYLYIKAFSGKKLFKTDRDLKKILITELKVTGDEHAVIKNNSLAFLSFSNCSLADTLKLRYEFPTEFELAPGSLIKIKANLGLNNSSADKLQIICEYGAEEPEFVVEDVFSYDEVDGGGFAIKSE